MLLLLVLCCKEAPTSAPIQSVHGIIYSSSGRIRVIECGVVHPPLVWLPFSSSGGGCPLNGMQNIK